jgi:hypothetical protein
VLCSESRDRRRSCDSLAEKEVLGVVSWLLLARECERFETSRVDHSVLVVFPRGDAAKDPSVRRDDGRDALGKLEAIAFRGRLGGTCVTALTFRRRLAESPVCPTIANESPRLLIRSTSVPSPATGNPVIVQP